MGDGFSSLHSSIRSFPSFGGMVPDPHCQDRAHEDVVSSRHSLLILVPHEDDCVIAAGRHLSVRNGRLGGVTRIVYLAPDETPGLPEIRAAEAYVQHGPMPDLAGSQSFATSHMLPPLRQPVIPRGLFPQGCCGIACDSSTTSDRRRSSCRCSKAATFITTCSPLCSCHIVTSEDSFKIYEAPEYSPYVSILKIRRTA